MASDSPFSPSPHGPEDASMPDADISMPDAYPHLIPTPPAQQDLSSDKPVSQNSKLDDFLKEKLAKKHED